MAINSFPINTRTVRLDQILAAEGYADAAEAARDSSFANAKGAATIADARALVADGETFIVYAAGAETFDAYRRLTSTTQEFLGSYPSAGVIAMQPGEPSVIFSDPSDNLLAVFTPDEILHPQIQSFRGDCNLLRSVNDRQPKEIDTQAALLGQLAHVIFWGQSLALGLGLSFDSSSLQNPEIARMPNGRVDWRIFNTDPAVAFSALEPAWRSGARAMVEVVQQLLEDEDGVLISDKVNSLLLSAPARTGTSISGLSTTHYGRFTEDVTQGKARADAAGLTYQPACVVWSQGESDPGLGTYLADLIAMRAATLATANTVANSTTPLPYLINQTPSWQAAGDTRPTIALAQLAAHAEPGMCCIGPIYHLSFGDSFHPSGNNAGYGAMGALFGLAFKRWFFDGVKPDPLRPLRADVIGDSVVVTMGLERGRRLVVDTATVTEQDNWGFTAVDGSGSDVTISSAALLGTDKVILKMASTPSPGWKVRYGWATISGRGVGNIRDDSPISWKPQRSSAAPISLAKWLCHFEETVQ